jgi:hypothetical protein
MLPYTYESPALEISGTETVCVPYIPDESRLLLVYCYEKD